MALPNVLFRVDGDSQIGLGHIYRCLALAEIIKQNFNATFAIRNPLPEVLNLITTSGFRSLELSGETKLIDEAKNLLKKLDAFELVVLDGYIFDAEYQMKIKESEKILIVIDDLCLGHFFADVIINHAPGITAQKYSCEKGTALYLGPQYALLREPFASEKPKEDLESTGSRLLVSFGGADPNNFTCKVLNIVRESAVFENITVITGSAFSHRKELDTFISSSPHILHVNNLNAAQVYEQMVKSDVAIVPSSTMLFETLATGTLALAGYYVHNQKLIYEGFLALGLIAGLGDLNKLTSEELRANIKMLSSDKEYGRSMKSKIAKVFDGGVKNRILKIFTTLLSHS